MANKGKTEKKKSPAKKEKTYSYYEFLEKFYPNSSNKKNIRHSAVKTFGSLLAEEAIKKVREKLQTV